MQKLISAIQDYRNTCFEVEADAARGLVGVNTIKRLHEEREIIFALCDKLEASIYCVCDDPAIKNNGQVIVCVKCGHQPKPCKCGKPADRDGVQCDDCYIRENT